MRHVYVGRNMFLSIDKLLPVCVKNQVQFFKGMISLVRNTNFLVLDTFSTISMKTIKQLVDPLSIFEKNRCATVLNLYLHINSIFKQKYFVDVKKTGCKGAKWVYLCSSSFQVGHLKFHKISYEAICCDSV